MYSHLQVCIYARLSIFGVEAHCVIMSFVKKNALHFTDSNGEYEYDTRSSQKLVGPVQRIEGDYETYSLRELQNLASVQKKPNLTKYKDSKGEPVKGDSSIADIIKALKQRDLENWNKTLLLEERRRKQQKQEEEDDKRFYADRREIEEERTFFSKTLKF